ncbi:MAG TPA: EI24 domain-containing protein [Myxococcota bacterium]|nr:EI24 domain-containing protein [Myxococcota bacterium]
MEGRRLTEQSFPVRAVRGVGFVLEGLARLMRDRKMFAVALAPAAITLAVFVGLLVGAAVLVPDLTSRWLPLGDWAALHGAAAVAWWLLRLVAQILVYALTALAWVAAFVTLFLGVSAALAAPFNELISEKVEEETTGVAAPPFSLPRFAGDAALAVGHTLLATALLAGGSVALALVGWLVPVVGTLVAFAGGICLTGFFLVLQGTDPAASRRRWSFRRKLALVSANFWVAGGFAAGGLVLLAIPVVNLLAVPALVAGGTRLFVEIEGPRGGAEPSSGSPLGRL